jgi:hypothetical protein
MHPIRQVFDDAPDSIEIPPELRHRRIELIMRPLDGEEELEARSDYERARVDRIEIPSREERNARR